MKIKLNNYENLQLNKKFSCKLKEKKKKKMQ